MHQRSLLLVLIALSAVATQKPDSRPAPGSTKLGDYMIEPELPSQDCAIDKHGSVGQLTQRIFYKERRVTAISYFSFVSPWYPSRLLYSVAPACAEDEQHSGTFYFDGRRDAPVQVSIGGTVASPETLPALWSPDDKFVALPANGMDFSLLDLHSAKSTNLSQLFYNHAAVMSTVEFRQWSPDSKKLAIVVSSTFYRPSGSMSNESELLAVDPSSLRPTYVATMRKERGWRVGQFVWVSNAGSFDLAIDPALQKSAAIFVKPPPSTAAPKLSN